MSCKLESYLKDLRKLKSFAKVYVVRFSHRHYGFTNANPVTFQSVYFTYIY
jgi:hypothetical protein